MTALFYITITTAFVAYIIHKLGAFPLILDRIRVEDEEPEKVQTPTAEPPKTWIEQEKEERAELEAQAYYVLLMQGHTTPGIVKYTSNIELLRIVDKYRHPNH